MIAFLGSVVLAAATATPPPTIIRERVSPVCTALHQLVVPLAQMNIKNRALTGAIRSNEVLIRKYQDTYLHDGVMIRVAQNDMLATNLLSNIHDVENQLLRSYQAYPQGTNAKVDALRQRVQNVVDIERAIANQYAGAYGAIIDNDQVKEIASGLDSFAGSSRAAGPPETPPAVLPLEGGAPDADSDPRLSSLPPGGLVMRTLKYAPLSGLQSLLRREGPALEAQALVAAHDCDGV